jgi:PAS domain S-box-containing protein
VRAEIAADVHMLATAAHHARDSILITDAQLDRPGPHIIYVNPAFTRMTGYSLDDVYGQTPRLLQGPKTDRAVLDRLRQTLARGEVFEGEGVNYRKDGTEFHIDWQAVPLRNAAGIVTHFIAYQRDVSERKRAELVLAQSEERYRMLVEQSPDAMFVHVDGQVVFANRATAALFGAEGIEALLGRSLLELVPEGERVEMQQRMAERSAEATPLFVQDFLRLDGQTVKTEGLCMPITYAGRPAKQMILRDLTENLRLEEQFRQAQRLESLGMLAAGIAHDLNNVLAPILMAAPMLRETATSALDRKLLTDIESSAVRGAGLVRQILGFARGIGGEMQTLPLRHLCEDIVSILSRTFPKSIRLELQVARDLWPVEANPTQLHQVLLNLCVNARDAMPDGGRLRLRAENDVLDELAARTIEGGRAGPWVVLQVEDSGTGIPAAVLAQMWDPFFTTKPAGKGTGLGLSTVRGIVETHGGFIGVQTAAGRGTVFRVYLPPTDGAAPAPTEESTVPHGQGEQVLIVEDEPSIRQLVHTILTRWGYRVVVAADGAEALERLCENGEVKLVVTDLDMPNLDGAQLARRVRQSRPEVRILATSGIEPDPNAAPQSELVGDAFLPKPFAAERLLTLAHELLHPAEAR